MAEKITTYERQVIPDRKIGLNVIGARYAAYAARYPGESIARGVASVGEGISDIGNVIAETRRKSQEAQDILDITKIVSDAETELLRIDESAKRHDNPKDYELESKEGMDNYFSDILSGIDNERIKARVQVSFASLQGKYNTRRLSNTLVKQEIQASVHLLEASDSIINNAFTEAANGNLDAAGNAYEKYSSLLDSFSGILPVEQRAGALHGFKKKIMDNVYRMSMITHPIETLENLKNNKEYSPLEIIEIQENAYKTSLSLDKQKEFEEMAKEEEIYKFFEGKAFDGTLTQEEMNSPKIQSMRPEHRNRIEELYGGQYKVSDPAIYNEFVRQIDKDPTSITNDDIDSTEGIALKDKQPLKDYAGKAREVTSRTNYKVGRDLVKSMVAEQIKDGFVSAEKLDFEIDKYTSMYDHILRREKLDGFEAYEQVLTKYTTDKHEERKISTEKKFEKLKEKYPFADKEFNTVEKIVDAIKNKDITEEEGRLLLPYSNDYEPIAKE